MKVIICDRCKKPSEGVVGRINLRMYKLTCECQNPKELGYWMGEKRTIELCSECLEKFFEREN